MVEMKTYEDGAEAMRQAIMKHLNMVADAMEANCRGDLGTMFAAQSASDIRRQARRIGTLSVPDAALSQDTPHEAR